MSLWLENKTGQIMWELLVQIMWGVALTHHIESDLYHREGKAITNFKTTLPKPHSDLARQTIKDPYIFDFLTIREQHEGFHSPNQKIQLNSSMSYFFLSVLFISDRLPMSAVFDDILLSFLWNRIFEKNYNLLYSPMPQVYEYNLLAVKRRLKIKQLKLV